MSLILRVTDDSTVRLIAVCPSCGAQQPEADPFQIGRTIAAAALPHPDPESGHASQDLVIADGTVVVCPTCKTSYTLNLVQG